MLSNQKLTQTFVLVLLLLAQRADAADLPRVQIHPGGHLLQTEKGRPFFWLGDTAWELIHRTTREECSYYLRTRAEQGFTVIQTVVLAEFDGINQPTALGERPFLNNDVRQPNEKYFDRVREIVEEASARGLYVALLPTWGDKLTAPWGVGPRFFQAGNLADAQGYTRYLAQKLRNSTNVLWMLGGDRPARRGSDDWTPVWRALAAGLAEGSTIPPVILYHPQGGINSSSVFLHNEPWLAVNGMQSGHGSGHDVPVWEWVARDYALTPHKPTLDLEPNYEDHPVNPWPRWDPANGYFRDYDVRKQVYRSVFAGACGVTYGHHAIWGFTSKRYEPINHVDRDWTDAIQRPAGRQMHFLRELIESRPFFDRIPGQSLIAGDSGQGGLHIQATMDAKGTYAFVYLPASDQTVTLDLTQHLTPLHATQLRAWWYDPRTGIGTLIGFIEGGKPVAFRSPSHGPDWVLVLDDPAAGYAPPGLTKMNQ